MANKKQTRPVDYYDPEGQVQTGYYAEGHVYQDEAGTVPISVGSMFRADDGSYYKMTPYGGVLWSSANKPMQTGQWLGQSDHWYRRAQDLTQGLTDREAFSYDPEQDPFYQGYQDQYLTQGRRAMTDAMAAASGLTGGYGSSYAQTVGQQAYDRELSQLWQLLPQLYDRAKEVYDDQTQAAYDELSAMMGLYDRDYQAFLQQMERADAQQKQDNWERQFQEDRRQFDSRQETDRQQQDQSDQERQRSYAYKMAMQALTQGLSVSDELLRQAGIDKDYAERLRSYYAAKLAK